MALLTRKNDKATDGDTAENKAAKSPRRESKRARNKQGDGSGKNDLRRLSRVELLDMLLEQTVEVERLTAENEALKAELAQVDDRMARIGSFESREQRVDEILAKLEGIVGQGEQIG